MFAQSGQPYALSVWDLEAPSCGALAEHPRAAFSESSAGHRLHPQAWSGLQVQWGGSPQSENDWPRAAGSNGLVPYENRGLTTMGPRSIILKNSI